MCRVRSTAAQDTPARPEMCSGSKAGSYSRLIDFVYHSTLGLRVIQKKKKLRTPTHLPLLIDLALLPVERDSCFVICGFEFRVSSSGFRVSVFGFRVSGFGFRVSGFEFRVSSPGFRFSGFGFGDFARVALLFFFFITLKPRVE